MRSSGHPFRSPAPAEREAGSGTVLALGLVGVLCALLVGALVLGGAIVASHRARAAADLAALAGAAASPPSCAEAERSAASHGARVASCRVEGADVEIEVVVDPGMGYLGPARGRARAGPETPP